jgi:hypothetical protein
VLLAVHPVVLGLQELRDLLLVGVEQFGGATLERIGDLRVRVTRQLAGDPLRDGPGRFSPVAVIARPRRSASRTSRKCSGVTPAGRMFGLTCRASRMGSVPRAFSATLVAPTFSPPARSPLPASPSGV